MSLVVITISGGCLESVKSTDPSIEYILLDRDNEEVDRLFEVPTGEFKGRYGDCVVIDSAEQATKLGVHELLNLLRIEHE